MGIRSMALMLAIVSLTFTPTGARAGPDVPILVSGFDDVLRQAENTGLIEGGLKLFQRDRTFAGMPELYREMTKPVQDQVKFPLISGTSSLFAGRIRRLLERSGFPLAELFLRDWLTEWSVEKFKTSRIEALVGDDPGQKFIVIFDNSEASVKMAKSIPEQFPGQTLAIYLHEIVARPDVAGAVQYITPLDIALNELKNGRLSESQVLNVAQGILSVEDDELVLPGYAYCPTTYSPCSGMISESVLSACEKVRVKIAGICGGRN